ncbi:hypothetical protein GCM10027435_11950 [Haloparvum alkalitolerans]|uniref:sensor histidine kinase n=1 Tax=Haloparvum alkalitolerans TaxID=1042953 RepID=UPI003CEAB024
MTAAADRPHALKALNTVATELKDCETPEEVCERTVDAAERILDFDLCVINLEEDGRLPIAAVSSGVPPDGATPMSVEEGIVGRAYRSGEAYVVDDIDEEPDANPQGPYGSALTIPIGDYGVFQAVSEETHGFDESDLELGELLVAHCSSALDRLEREAEIREHVHKLERQNDRLEEFADVVSHDLRNPLSVLEGYLELARETGDPEHFDRCEEAVERMHRLIDGLLTLARQGESLGETEELSLASVVEPCWRTADTDAADLVLEGDATLSGDPERLRQLFENLFRNAVEHGTGEEGAPNDLTIRVGVLPDGAGFYVEDDGVGIPPAERSDVLEPGYTTNEGGTGFGLGIVKGVADAHGWTLRIDESEGGGARFEFHGIESLRSDGAADENGTGREEKSGGGVETNGGAA